MICLERGGFRESVPDRNPLNRKDIFFNPGYSNLLFFFLFF